MVRNLPPGFVLLLFRERRQDRVCFASRFNHLPLPEIFFRVVVRLEQHVLDLLVGESVTRLNIDFSLLSAALLARRDAQNAVGVDQKLYFNARHTGGPWWNTPPLESCPRPPTPPPVPLPPSDGN